MKNLILLTIILISFMGCKSEEQKRQEEEKKLMENTVDTSNMSSGIMDEDGNLLLKFKDDSDKKE